ncbi:phage tail tape measure protein [Vibrio aerogenes]|nr:phage tail tape measure protein [Vibrio aerogenes]
MASDKKNLAVRLERIRQLQAQLNSQTQTLADKTRAVAAGIEQSAAGVLSMGSGMAQSMSQATDQAAGFGNQLAEAGLISESTKNQLTGFIDSARQFGQQAGSSFNQAANGIESLKTAGLDTDKVLSALGNFQGLANMTGMGDELKAIEGSVQSILPVVSQTADQVRQVSGIFKDFSADTGLDKLGENLKTARGQAGETRKEFRKFGKLSTLMFAKIRRGDSLPDLMDHTLRMASVAQTGAGKIEALGKTVSNALAAPTQYAADFKDKIATVAKAANATDAQLGQLSASARQLGLNTSIGTNQAVAGMQALASAGLNASQIQAAMPDVINIAKASGNTGDLNAVGTTTAALMAEFDIVPEKMGALSDVLATATSSTGLKLSALGDTMRGIGPIARHSGMNLKETAAMAGLLADMGVKGADAGASLEAMSARLSSPSDAAAATLQRLGVSTKDAGGKMRNTAQVIGDVIKATKDMAPEAQLKAMQDVLGEDSANSLQAAAQKGGKGVSGFNDVLNTQEGASADIAGGVDQSIQGGINKLSAVVDSIKLRFGDLMTPVKGFADSVVSAAQKVPEMTKAYADFVKDAKSAYQSVQALKDAYPQLGQQAKKAMRRMKALGRLTRRFSTRSAGRMMQSLQGISGRLLRMIPPSAVRMISGFGGTLMRLAMSVFPVVMSGIRAIGMAMMANPVGLVITAIAAVAGLIYYYWEPIKKFMGTLWDGFVAGLDWVMEAWNNFSLLDALKTLFEWSPMGLLMKVWGAAFDWIHEKFGGVANIVSGIFSFFTGGDDEEEKERKQSGRKQQNKVAEKTQSVRHKVKQAEKVSVQAAASEKLQTKTATVAKAASKGQVMSARGQKRTVKIPKAVRLKKTYRETVHAHTAVAAGQSQSPASIPETASRMKRGGQGDSMISINQLDIHVQGNDSMDMRDLAGEVRRQFMALMEHQKMKYRGGLYDY